METSQFKADRFYTLLFGVGEYNIFIERMRSAKFMEEEPFLSMKTVTWQKDSHSLFDYEFNKNVVQNIFQFPLTEKYVFIYRNNESSQVYFKESQSRMASKELHQLLGGFCIKQQNKKQRLQFYNSETIRSWPNNTHISAAGDFKNDEIYLIVRSLKNKNNQNKGYKLSEGHIIKLGRVEYRVTSINNSAGSMEPENKSKFWMNNKTITVEDVLESTQYAAECKYCMLGEGTDVGQFLCAPCKCSGTCALVHFRCLQKWNQSKVKKEVVGGTIQYNFEKFYCEVCKEEYPRFVIKSNVQYELMPIEKPTGPHLMLQGVSQKANNMMVIQNIPEGGIKLGRGHECEIRVTDISVSRNHARIDKVGDDYYIFDNKSKFGTLVKEEQLSLDLSRIKQGVQIGRTVITFQRMRKP